MSFNYETASQWSLVSVTTSERMTRAPLERRFAIIDDIVRGSGGAALSFSS
jgi:hypothetical protein